MLEMKKIKQYPEDMWKIFHADDGSLIGRGRHNGCVELVARMGIERCSCQK